MKYVEITPAMIQAGVEELRELYFGLELSEIVKAVFLAMLIAMPDQGASLAPANAPEI